MAASSSTPNSPSRKLTALVAAALAVLVVGFALATTAPAADLQSRLDSKQAALNDAKDKQGVLTTEVSRYNDQIDQLTGEVAALRNREAAVKAELDQAQAELDSEQHDLKILRERLARSVDSLQDHLVEIYKSDEPSAISTILQSDGFDDALGRYEYLQSIQEQSADLVGRVRELRDDTASTVARVKATRDAIAARHDELVRTRSALEAREADLDAARDHSKAALDRIGEHVGRLDDETSKIEDKIQDQLAQAALAQAGVPALPAGAIQAAGGGFIWPINGTITSPFGIRWGSLHAGIDIAASEGTPIRAAKAGTIALSQTEAESGGYGNYTCIDHGSGLSTCYAHQSAFAITSGPVEQGEVIGYVGNTGHSFGAHLHFEVRINGTPVDPLGYL